MILRYTLSAQGLEESADLFVESTDDTTLFAYEADPSPRLMFLMAEGTKLAEKGLEDKTYAETAYERVETLLHSDDATVLKSMI
jgi:hypothetical protein